MPPPKPTKNRFVYKSRSLDQVKKRAEQKGGAFDRAYIDSVQVFAPQAGDHRIRVLPPTWETPGHYGYDAWFHSNIGPDQQSYLCPDKMNNDRCPICDELKTIRGNDKEAEEMQKALRPYKRVLVWVIDRNDEAAGPQLYAMPWTVDRDISILSIDKQDGGHLEIDHPETGYDIEFSKEGSGIKTKYTGLMIARRSTPLATDERTADEWLDIVDKHPIPEVLQFYSYEHISKTFDGTAAQETTGVSTRTTETEGETRRTTKLGNTTRTSQEFQDRMGTKTEDETEEDETEEEAEEVPEEVKTTSMSTREKIRAGLERARNNATR